MRVNIAIAINKDPDIGKVLMVNGLFLV